ncbi:MAG: hypothetical protein ACI9LV_001025 [Candidatus Nanohaloarchaea archaeon]|jgi:hypothetical protein
MVSGNLKTYLNHFLPREIVGPVIIVFSLEGVISGLFDLYVPQEFATLAWGAIFLMSVYLVAKWGTTGEAEEELEEKLEGT